MKRLTSSIVLFLVCIGLVFGIALASWLSVIPMMVGALIGGGVVAWIGRTAPMRDRFVAIVIVGVALGVGAFRYSSVGPGANSIAIDAGRFVVVQGLVTGADLTDDGTSYTLADLVVDDVHRDDKLLVQAPISSTAMIGDTIAVACALQKPKPFDGFAYDRFLAAKSVYVTCSPSAAPSVISSTDGNTMRVVFWKFVGTTHAFLDTRVRQILPEPQATLLLGLLIGENSFSKTWKTVFKNTGTSHIVAASGYNVAIVAELALLGLISLGLYRKQAFPLVVIAIGFFVILAGAGAAVMRAGVMGVLALAARHAGRHTSPRNIIALVVAVMLVIEPRLFRDDVGFQLSVAATMGLIVLTDRIAPLLKEFVPSAFGIRESLASTIAATIATLPITLVSFGAISIVAPLVNMLVLPCIPYAMSLGAVAIIGSAMVPQIGVWLALPAWTALVTMTGVMHAFAHLSWSYLAISPMLSVALSLLGIVLVALIVRKLPKSFERELDAWQWRNAVMMVGIFLLLFMGNLGVIAWRSDRAHSSTTHVWVFDIGQGDGIFIDGKEKDIVIDGGPTRFGMVEHLATVRFPWERHVDAVIATHPHADHIIGLIGLIGTYSVEEVVQNGSVYAAPSAEAFNTAISASRSVSVIASSAKQSWLLGSDASLKILWPTDTTSNVVADNVHERSVVALLTVGLKTMLFTGDAEADVEAKLLDNPDLAHGVDVLKVGHHGSDTSTSDAFLQLLKPRFAVISVGVNNHFGHPSPFTVGRLQSIGAEIFRTDLDGDVRVDMTGSDVNVK